MDDESSSDNNLVHMTTSKQRLQHLQHQCKIPPKKGKVAIVCMCVRVRVIPQADSGSTDIHRVYPAYTLHLNTLTQVLPCLSRCAVSQNTYPAERSSLRAILSPLYSNSGCGGSGGVVQYDASCGTQLLSACTHSCARSGSGERVGVVGDGGGGDVGGLVTPARLCAHVCGGRAPSRKRRRRRRRKRR